MKCDLQELEDQIRVRYLNGLDPRYSHVAE